MRNRVAGSIAFFLGLLMVVSPFSGEILSKPAGAKESYKKMLFNDAFPKNKKEMEKLLLSTIWFNLTGDKTNNIKFHKDGTLATGHCVHLSPESNDRINCEEETREAFFNYTLTGPFPKEDACHPEHYKIIITESVFEDGPREDSYFIPLEDLGSMPLDENGTVTSREIIFPFWKYSEEFLTCENAYSAETNIPNDIFLSHRYVMGNFRDNDWFSLNIPPIANQLYSEYWRGGESKFDAISMGMKKGKVLENLKIRVEPRLPEPEEENNLVDFIKSENSEPQTFLPAGMTITVLARTKDKQKVQKWNNYWYYVAYPSYREGQKMQMYAWVFGEFLKVK